LRLPALSFRLSVLLLAALLSVSSTTVSADQPSPLRYSAVDYNLPAGDLSEALTLLSRQAGITLSYDRQQLAGFKVNALQGRYPIRQAFDILLQGTGLQAVAVGSSGWLIESSPQGSLTVLDAIQVESRNTAMKDQVYREPASVNVITRDQIERFRGTSVGDIFQGTPGVLVSENRNSGGLDINIRGMQGQGRVPVLIDGSRQETTVYRGYSGVSSRSYIDPDLIGSVRIDKGPVMTADGTGATGGVVSASTLRAEDLVKPGELSGIRLRISGIGNNSSSPAPGTYAGYYLPSKTYRSDCRFESDCTEQYLMPDQFAPDTGMDRPGMLEFGGYAFSLAGTRRFIWGDLVAAYALREQGNYYAGSNGPSPDITIHQPTQLAWYKETEVSRDGASPFRAGERIPNTNFSSESWLLKSSLLLPQDQTLELGYIRYNSRHGEMMPSQIRSFGQARQWLDSEVLNQSYTARYHWQPVEYDWADLKINLWHTDAVTDLNTPAVGSVDLADNIARTDDYQRWGLDISNAMLFFPVGQLQLSYGFAGQWEDVDTDTPQTDSFYSGSRKGSRTEYSAFTSVEWQLTPQWQLQAGIRRTRFESRDDNALPVSVTSSFCEADGNGGCLPVYYENDDAGNAPVFALTWEPISGLQLYLRRAEAIRMPSLFESTAGWSVSPALDIPLKGEHARNKEIGLNYLTDHAFGSDYRLQFKLAYFRNHVDNYLTRTQPNTWEERQSGMQDYFRMRNIDSLDLHGLELNLGIDASRWLAEISATKYRYIEVCNVGSYVRYYCNDWGLTQSYVNNMVPPTWHASLHLGARLLDQKLEFGTRATYVGQRNRVPAYNADEGFNLVVPWHSYQIWDLYAKYQFNNDSTVDFTIDNVTDRYYLDALGLGLVPAPGRTAKLSFTQQF